MKESHLISIIIPIYNAQKSIEKCINSTLNQTYKNIEIICINDGSKDDSRQILDELVIKDNRLKSFNIENSGVSNARNIGIDKSNGECIFFLDADDWLESNAIEMLMESYTKTKADIVIGDFVKIKGNEKISSGHGDQFNKNTHLNKKKILEYVKVYLQTSYKDLLFNHCWGKLYKSSILKEHNVLFDIRLHGFEDIDFNFRVLEFVNEIIYSNNVIYNYQLAINSQSSQISLNVDQIDKFFITFENIMGFLKTNKTEIIFDIKQEVGHFYISNMIMILIRTCGQISKNNERDVFNIIKVIINNKNIINHLKYYNPRGKETWLMPYLMRLRLIKPVLYFGKYKYYKHRTDTFLELIKVILK